ncbi:MAG TPA: prenyltransferase/squalene oxidase repeat-containing protein [Planctomycetaceae bacterium]|nr:prenyltransferase/squalene oxidase repeat-containing protein [Planctomycetaceae bacterium]
MLRCTLFLSCLVLCCSSASLADEPQELNVQVRSSIERGLVPILAAVERYPSHRKCFSCHHQTLPMLAIRSVREAGLPGDFDKPFEDSWTLTAKAFENRLQTLQSGGRIGGDSATVSHALWSAEITETRNTELTESFLAYLIQKQHADGYWKPQSDRPPLEGTKLSTTALVIALLEVQSETEERSKALQQARTWIDSEQPQDQQERAFLFWHLSRTKTQSAANAGKWETLLDAIRKKQRSDGGWSQLDDEAMPSDAYATGQTLYVLLTGGIPREDPMIRSGVEFLVKSQQEDGSWFVQTRSKPVQPWYDNGDPHGKSQFISTPASCWAVAALAKSLPGPSSE